MNVDPRVYILAAYRRTDARDASGRNDAKEEENEKRREMSSSGCLFEDGGGGGG